MSNNTVDLSGYIVVCDINTVMAGGKPCSVISGWIFTGLAALGGKHPFTATGKPADVILDQARSRQGITQCEAADFSNCQVGVTARGKLVSGSERAFLEVRHISFFDTSNPLQSGRKSFVVNTVKLQGQIAVDIRHETDFVLLDRTSPVLAAWMSTDKIFMGGRHPIIFSGSLRAEMLRMDILEHGFTSVRATVGGSLHSVGNVIYVLASYLSINGNVLDENAQA